MRSDRGPVRNFEMIAFNATFDQDLPVRLTNGHILMRNEHLINAELVILRPRLLESGPCHAPFWRKLIDVLDENMDSNAAKKMLNNYYFLVEKLHLKKGLKESDIRGKVNLGRCIIDL